MKKFLRVVFAIALVMFFTYLALLFSSIVDNGMEFSESLQYIEIGIVSTILVYIIYDRITGKENKD